MSDTENGASTQPMLETLLERLNNLESNIAQTVQTAVDSSIAALTLRLEGQPPSAMQPIDAEVPAIERENLPETIALSDMQERRVGEIHRLVGVRLHQLAHPLRITGSERRQREAAGFHQRPELFLGAH